MTLSIRPGTAADLDAADHIFRRAFGTFLGFPDPLTFSGDGAWVRSRFRITPDAFWVAEDAGQLVGSVNATRWGTVGFFGPLTIEPSRWNQGVAQQLLAPVLQRFGEWNLTHSGLYTFAASAKQVTLYAKFGFWPGNLVAIMAKPVSATATAAPIDTIGGCPAGLRTVATIDCRLLADEIHAGLDLTAEIDALLAFEMGDVVLLRTDRGLDGFAACHTGPGTEADTGLCLVKFGAVRPGDGAATRFGRLLDACEQLAASRGLATIAAGTSMGRRDAYGILRAHGFHTFAQGVTMHAGTTPGYHHPGAFVIDDWR